MDVPKSTSYDIVTTYNSDNVTNIYKVNIYENIFVIQNINVVPNMSFEERNI